MRPPQKGLSSWTFSTIFGWGVFRDFIASTIFQLLRWGFFGLGSVPVRLAAAHSHFKMWQRTVQKSAALRSFTMQLMQYVNLQSYPWANVKGSDATLCMRWLQVAIAGKLNLQDENPARTEALKTMLSVARLGNRFFSLAYSHGVWLPRPCAQELYRTGRAFVVGYGKLATFAFKNRECLYSLKPKLHFHCHCLVDLRRQLESEAYLCLNPAIFDCQQNEDIIGRVSKLARATDIRVLMTGRVLELLYQSECPFEPPPSKTQMSRNLKMRQKSRVRAGISFVSPCGGKSGAQDSSGIYIHDMKR